MNTSIEFFNFVVGFQWLAFYAEVRVIDLCQVVSSAVGKFELTFISIWNVDGRIANITAFVVITNLYTSGNSCIPTYRILFFNNNSFMSFVQECASIDLPSTVDVELGTPSCHITFLIDMPFVLDLVFYTLIIY